MFDYHSILLIFVANKILFISNGKGFSLLKFMLKIVSLKILLLDFEVRKIYYVLDIRTVELALICSVMFTFYVVSLSFSSKIVLSNIMCLNSTNFYGLWLSRYRVVFSQLETACSFLWISINWITKYREGKVLSTNWYCLSVNKY